MEPWREEVRDDYLMHYGVKGMKWRKHKFRSREKNVTGVGKGLYKRKSTKDSPVYYHDSQGNTIEYWPEAGIGSNLGGGNDPDYHDWIPAYETPGMKKKREQKELISGAKKRISDQLKKVKPVPSHKRKETKAHRAWRKARGKGLEISESASETAKTASKKVKKTANKAYQTAKATGKKVSKSVKTGTKKASQFVSNLFKKKKR